VALDTITGEVGSAGASCVDLFETPFTEDGFLGELFPGQGAINCQAYYLSENQLNARKKMLAGESAEAVVNWLIQNDLESKSYFRQYGAVSFSQNKISATAFTGDSTDAYTGHIIGRNYSIQGNILIGEKVLLAMEKAFLETDGDLSCKLMAALQGANIVGADRRCAPNKSSSLFAFVKVAQKADIFGTPSLKLSFRSHSGDQIEQIDSFQSIFDKVNLSCP